MNFGDFSTPCKHPKIVSVSSVMSLSIKLSSKLSQLCDSVYTQSNSLSLFASSNMNFGDFSTPCKHPKIVSVRSVMSLSIKLSPKLSQLCDSVFSQSNSLSLLACSNMNFGDFSTPC